MIARSPRFSPQELNIVGSSVFGRYPKIGVEHTYNMFISDNFMVPYAGYQTAINSSAFNNGTEGRGSHTSTKLGKIVRVVNSSVYLVNLFFDQNLRRTFDTSVIKIGTLSSTTGVVYFAENNKPQILISDRQSLYIYDPTLFPSFQQVPTIDFTPGFIDFHDTYFLCAASNDNFYSPPANNTWRLSAQNDGLTWPNTSQTIGLLQTKPDNVQAVLRFPSKGNLIFVMGETVTESWFDTGSQLFPYQRNNAFNIDYGCLNPATIARLDQLVVWLAQNESSGPIIMYSSGDMPQKITTDGIDYLFSQLTNPADSQGFLYRQDGHLFYQINFYTDNMSLFYDFNTGKFYNCCDENLNYFIASDVSFFNNQYYFGTRNNGNLYAFDTIFTTYDGAEIPRIRTCKNIRLPSQEYFVANDIGFTIEQGETDYQVQGDPPINTLPRVDLSISRDGGYTFGSDFGYTLNPPGVRKNRLMWWQCGVANDMVCQFKFWGMGRFVATDGVVNIRQ